MPELHPEKETNPCPPPDTTLWLKIGSEIWTRFIVNNHPVWRPDSTFAKAFLPRVPDRIYGSRAPMPS